VIGHIGSITVRDGPKELPAEFLGLYAGFGAFLVRARNVSGAPADLSDAESLPRGKLFFTVSVRRRYGRRWDAITYNRVLDVSVGYRETISPVPVKEMEAGDWAVDERGRFLGFFTRMKREKADELRVARRGGANAAAVQDRLYLFSEVAAELRRPAAHFDPAARPKSQEEARRFVWLGVEWQPMTFALAQALGAQDATRDGARGLLVQHVYAHSPAERLGIVAGDILLSLGLPGQPEEFDLHPAGKARELYFGPPFTSSFPRRMWRPRRNYLTAFLQVIGADRTVLLRRLHDGAELVQEVELEKAPDDFDTVRALTNRTLGLSVKPLTYEVRSVLRLEGGPGVVVSEVVPGGKADVAGVQTEHIITSVDSRPVASPEAFDELVESSARDGRVQLLVEFLDQSRVVEVEIEPGAF
jgi:hypothetical protein